MADTRFATRRFLAIVGRWAHDAGAVQRKRIRQGPASHSSPVLPPPKLSSIPPLERLLNAAGQALKPQVLCTLQLKNQGAGMPDGGLFVRPWGRARGGEPAIAAQPERGVVEVKRADADLDELARGEQIRKYLQHYGLVLATNLREFRLLGSGEGGAVPY